MEVDLRPRLFSGAEPGLRREEGATYPWLLVWPCGHWARYSDAYPARDPKDRDHHWPEIGQFARLVYERGCSCVSRFKHGRDPN